MPNLCIVQASVKMVNEVANTNGVSVIICCYNSAERLPQTLQHLAKQIVPHPFFWEIILVNNVSTDDTVDCAKREWDKINAKTNVTFRIVDEPEAGQMFARKKGVKESRFEYIVFCDDDNWLSDNYVACAKEILEKNQMIGAVGGQNLPLTNANEFPEWFEEYKDKYGLGIPAEKSGDVSHKTFVLGAGQATRKSLYLQIFADQYPSLLNGRNGGKLSTGDDFEYCKRLLLWGYQLYYDERMVLHHFIPKERLTIAYRTRLLQGIEDAGKVLDEYDVALQLHQQNLHKNKWRLLVLAPFRIALIRLGLSRRKRIDQQLTFFYLSPFFTKTNDVKMVIKKFIQHK